MVNGFFKKIKLILVIIGGTVTIMFTHSMIYATKTEVAGLQKTIDNIYIEIIETRRELNDLQNLMIEKNLTK